AALVNTAGAAMNVKIASGLSLIGVDMPRILYASGHGFSRAANRQIRVARDRARRGGRRSAHPKIPCGEKTYGVTLATAGIRRLAGLVTYEMASNIRSAIGMNCSKAGSPARWCAICAEIQAKVNPA